MEQTPESGDGKRVRLSEFRASEEQDGQRLDVVLAAAFPEHSRASLQRVVRSGAATLNDKPSKPSELLKPGDMVAINWPPQPEDLLVAEDLPLNLIFEDAQLLVVNKPPDLVVHPNAAYRTGTLVHALLHHDADAFGGLVDETLRPGIVHRLDKDTSGLLVVAKTPEARRALKAAFKQRDVEKTYLTVVHGEFGAVTGTIDAPIGRHPRNRTKMAVVEEDGKPAVTHYRVLGASQDCALLQVRIETGRTHQIRVHFSHLRHPVLGDVVYGLRREPKIDGLGRQMLHAWKLVFPHPVTGVKREYTAPPPQDFQEVCLNLGLPVVGGAPT